MGLYRGVTRLTLNLDPKKTYYFAPYAKNAMTVVMGNVVPFTMPMTSAPAFDEPTVTKTTETSGTVSAKLRDVGSETSVIMRGYVYKEATGGVNSVDPQDLVLNDVTSRTGGFGTLLEDETLEDMIPNLKPGKTYAVRAYALAEGVGYSNIAYIQTRATDDMAISVIDETLVSEGILSAYFIQRGNQEIAQVGFCYTEGTTVDPVIGNSQLVEGRLDGDVITGQLPRLGYNTTYSIRAYATTTLGDTFYGEITELGNNLDLSGYITRDYLQNNYYNMTEVQALVDSALLNSQYIDHRINELQSALNDLNVQVQNNYVTQAEYNAMYTEILTRITDLQTQQNTISSDLTTISADLQAIRTEYANKLYVDSLVSNKLPTIGNDGYWYIGTTNTGVRAQGEDGVNGVNGTNGQDGLTPYIGDNGNWFIGTTDTGVKADVSDDIADLYDQINILKAALDDLKEKVDGLQTANITPLPVPFSGFAATADGNNAISVSATLNMADYRQSYVTAFGNSANGNDYYTKLYPVSMTGFLYSATNTEPDIESYAAMIVAQADSTYSFAATIEGLSPGTTYYARAFAVSSWGVSYSSVQAVTTAGSSGVTPTPGDNPYPGTVGVKRRR